MPSAITLEILPHRGRVLAGVDHQVNQSHDFELLGIVEPAAQNQFLRTHGIKRRQSRLYAPIPGNRLNRISGSPIRLPPSAMIRSLVRTASKPPPRASPYQTDRQDRQVHLGQVLVHRIQTTVRVVAKLLLSTRPGSTW